MALDNLPDLFAHRFLCFSSSSIRFSYSYMRQTKLTSSQVKFLGHNKILIYTYILTRFKVVTKMMIFG